MQSRSQIYEKALREDKTMLLNNTGALVAYSGEKTGRSPKDKRVVLDDNTKDIWWGSNSASGSDSSSSSSSSSSSASNRVNRPLRKELFNAYRDYAKEYLDVHQHPYTVDAYAGWDNQYRLKIRTRCTNGYHALFMTNMLIPSETEFDLADFTIYNVGELSLRAVDSRLNELGIERDPTLDDTLVVLDFTQMEMVIYGTRYAGEMKKGVLTLFMYLMPLNNNLTLHSSANVDPKTNESCLFFGLSGTGKTTISADPNRDLIGDDEHVWTSDGIFNIEGGCYAKCIGLSEESEPEIFRAIKYNAVLENVVLDLVTREVDYNDISITPNTRVAYPLSHIPNVRIPAKAGHPKQVILLICDAFGVLPPIAKLSPEQAVYFFVNGYTSKIPGTEMGITEPIATFSACFGEPFLVHHPLRYGELLKEKLEEFGCQTWLINTGWTGGSYGVGNRISLKYTRRMVEAIHSGELTDTEFTQLDHFNIDMPIQCDGVPDTCLNPKNSWKNPEEYDVKLLELYERFENNNCKYIK
jgi:phosphoenolpyruvate carboxykinase (ATP)